MAEELTSRERAIADHLAAEWKPGELDLVFGETLGAAFRDILAAAGPKACSITKDWYGEPHGPHEDGHDCWDNANDHYDNAYFCSVCGFMVQVG